MNKNWMFLLLGIAGVGLLMAGAGSQADVQEAGQAKNADGDIVDWEVVKMDIAEYRGRWKQDDGDWEWVPSNLEPETRATWTEAKALVVSHIAQAGYTEPVVQTAQMAASSTQTEYQ